MHIHLSPRHLALTSAIHSHVAEKISHLEEIAPDIMAAHVVLIHDSTSKPARSHGVKVHLAVPGPDIYAEDWDADLYAAIDKVVGKLARQLRKRKTKLHDKRQQTAQRRAEIRKSRG